MLLLTGFFSKQNVPDRLSWSISKILNFVLSVAVAVNIANCVVDDKIDFSSIIFPYQWRNGEAFDSDVPLK